MSHIFGFLEHRRGPCEGFDRPRDIVGIREEDGKIANTSADREELRSGTMMFKEQDGWMPNSSHIANQNYKDSS